MRKKMSDEEYRYSRHQSLLKYRASEKGKAAMKRGSKMASDRKTEKHKQAILKLGGKCNNPNCPIPQDKMDFCCLTIDHINNDGVQERKVLGGAKICNKILAGEPGYQCLCIYCNWKKRRVRTSKRW